MVDGAGLWSWVNWGMGLLGLGFEGNVMCIR